MIILRTAGILCGWIGYNVVLLILFVLVYKKDEIQPKIPYLPSFRWACSGAKLSSEQIYY
jgi:hypothetical protein